MTIRTDSLSDDAFKVAYERSASFWGMDGNSEMSLEMFRSRFASLPTDATYQYSPTSFDLGSDVTFFPMQWNARWDALEGTIRELKPKALLSLIPSGVSVGTIFFESLRRTESIGTNLTTANIPLAVEVMKQLHVEILIGMPAHISAFFSSVQAGVLLPLKAVHLVVEPENIAAAGSYLVPTLRDLHIMPGVSIAWQCMALAKQGASFFHPSGSFAWHVDDGYIHVTSLDDRPAPLFRFRVGRGVIEECVCTCGERSLLKLYGK